MLSEGGKGGGAELYNQATRGVCLAPQCLPSWQACISNVIYYCGDVCPGCLSDETALLSNTPHPLRTLSTAGIKTLDRLLYLSSKPGWSAARNEAGKAVQMSEEAQIKARGGRKVCLSAVWRGTGGSLEWRSCGSFFFFFFFWAQSSAVAPTGLHSSIRPSLIKITVRYS